MWLRYIKQEQDSNGREAKHIRPYGDPVGEPLMNPGEPGTPRFDMGTLL